VSGTGTTGGGSGYAAILAHAEGVLYGMELGSVTLKINNQHTHTPESGLLSEAAQVARGRLRCLGPRVRS
jgi:hypothetical protein